MVTLELHPLPHFQQMHMVCMIWQEMSGNGVAIGMVEIIITLVQVVILKVLVAVLVVFCVAAAGAARLRTAVLPIATSTPHLTVTIPTVFGWHFPSKQLGITSELSNPFKCFRENVIKEE